MTLECKNFGSILIIILNGYKLNLMDVAITFWRILGQKIIKFEPFRVSFISEHPVNLSSFYQENEGKNLNYLLQAMSITEKDELNNIFLSKFNYRGIVVFSALVSISKRKYLSKDARGKAELLPSNCQYTCRARIALWWYKNEKWGKSILQSSDWQEKLYWSWIHFVSSK